MSYQNRVVPSDLDILCEACGYTLTGLPVSGQCPECGESIAISTTASPRHAPVWEKSMGTSAFTSTAFSVMNSPRGFFKTLALEEHPRSRRFRTFSVMLLAIISCVAVTLHYNWAIAFWGFSPLTFSAIGISLAIGAVGAKIVLLFGLLLAKPIAWLTTLESNFWGYRMPRPRVQRALDYHAIHTIPAAILILLVVIAHRVLLSLSIVSGADGITYLYTLSAVTVVCVGYVFYTYTLAMRAIMFANNRVETLAAKEP